MRSVRRVIRNKYAAYSERNSPMKLNVWLSISCELAFQIHNLPTGMVSMTLNLCIFFGVILTHWSTPHLMAKPDGFATLTSDSKTNYITLYIYI